MRRCLPLAAIAAALAIVALPACEDDPDDRKPGPRSLEGFDSDPVAVLRVDEEGFTPGTVSIPAGEILELRNAGDEPHSFEAGDDLETGTLLPGETTDVVFDEPAEIEIHDGHAPDHEATIVVTAPR